MYKINLIIISIILLVVGIANGQIYLKRTNELDVKIFGDKLIDLSLDIWSEGWELWVDPLTLTENIISQSDINAKIEEAVRNEDYELAEKLRKQIK